MVPIRQRAPASSGLPLMPTPAQQGLEDTELPGSFPGQALQPIFGKQGAGRQEWILAGQSGACRGQAHTPRAANSPVPYSRCQPALLGLTPTGGQR